MLCYRYTKQSRTDLLGSVTCPPPPPGLCPLCHPLGVAPLCLSGLHPSELPSRPLVFFPAVFAPPFHQPAQSRPLIFSTMSPIMHQRYLLGVLFCLVLPLWRPPWLCFLSFFTLWTTKLSIGTHCDMRTGIHYDLAEAHRAKADCRESILLWMPLSILSWPLGGVLLLIAH